MDIPKKQRAKISRIAFESHSRTGSIQYLWIRSSKSGLGKGIWFYKLPCAQLQSAGTIFTGMAERTRSFGTIPRECSRSPSSADKLKLSWMNSTPPCQSIEAQGSSIDQVDITPYMPWSLMPWEEPLSRKANIGIHQHPRDVKFEVIATPPHQTPIFGNICLSSLGLMAPWLTIASPRDNIEWYQ